MPVSNPLKWHGGKSYLAARIIEQFPESWTHYVEPYFGGGAVFFRKQKRDESEVINDVNGELVNFYHVLQTRFDDFSRLVELTPFSEELFYESLETYGEGDEVARAVDFFIRYRQSRQALGKDFATLTRNRTRRGINEQVSAYLSAVEGLQDAHERLQTVAVLCRPALDVIRQQDGPNTFFYLDPPYLHETRQTTADYEFEMSEGEHEDLLRLLSKIKGRFVLSGYLSLLYDGYAGMSNWRRVDIEIDNKASSKATKDKKTECLWMNY